MGTMEIWKEIDAFMGKVSYLDLDGYPEREECPLSYGTRRNGNVGDETYGEEDYEHAHKVKGLLLVQFGRVIKRIGIETTDEWVHFDVFLREDCS